MKVKKTSLPFLGYMLGGSTTIVKGKEYQVEALKMTLKLEDVYIIGERLILIGILLQKSEIGCPSIHIQNRKDDGLIVFLNKSKRN